MEQAEGEAPYYALRYMDQETQAFRTFTPARDAYNTFAVAMRIAQIASTTRRELRITMETETAVDPSDSAVGAGNIMRVLGLCSMSEYIHETEQREKLLALVHQTSQIAEPHMPQEHAHSEEEKCREHSGERWPDTKNRGKEKRKKMLRMITNTLKVETQGEVLASKNCNWIKEWAQQWGLEVTHYRYKRKSHLLPVSRSRRTTGGGVSG